MKQHREKLFGKLSLLIYCLVFPVGCSDCFLVSHRRSVLVNVFCDFTTECKLVRVTSEQQYILLHKHDISVQQNSSLNRADSCFVSHIFCVLHNTFVGKLSMLHLQKE